MHQSAEPRPIPEHPDRRRQPYAVFRWRTDGLVPLPCSVIWHEQAWARVTALAVTGDEATVVRGAVDDAQLLLAAVQRFARPSG